MSASRQRSRRSLDSRMKCTWVRTGEDGRSHFADLDIPLKDLPRAPGDHRYLSDTLPALGYIFGETPADRPDEFHPAPFRQFLIVLSGVLEVECGDGSRRRIGSGEVLLAEDTTGEGHITRNVGGPRRDVRILLPDDFDPSVWAGGGAR
jgi:hypothetical protein